MVGSCPCTLAQRNLDIVYILDSSVSIPIEHWEEFTDGIADLVWNITFREKRTFSVAQLKSENEFKLSSESQRP